MRRWLGWFSAMLLGTATAGAQASVLLAYVPPPMTNGQDRNDPGVHFGIAEDEIGYNALAADSQLVWSSRLDPSWAPPLYGRAFCQERLWQSGARLAFAVTGEPEPPSRAQIVLYDSLMLAAMTRDPFPDHRLRAQLSIGRTRSMRITMWMGKKKVKLPEEVDRGDLEFFRGDYKAALADWATALHKMPELYWLHSLRAEAFYALQSYDSVITQLRLVADTLAKMEQHDLVREFDSRAIALYAIAHTQVQRDDYQAARQAYQEALTVDFGFYMAHARLAGLALLTNDTATAVSELRSAVQLNETDASILFFYGYALMSTGATDSAAVQFRKAIAVDPYYAAPYEMLGRILERRGQTAQAIAAYQGFIDHAARSDPELISNVARVATLSRMVAAAH